MQQHNQHLTLELRATTNIIVIRTIYPPALPIAQIQRPRSVSGFSDYLFITRSERLPDIPLSLGGAPTPTFSSNNLGVLFTPAEWHLPQRSRPTKPSRPI